MDGLLNVLAEQAIFGFTGRINLIKSDNRQFLGEIVQKDGVIVDASYKGLSGKKALYTSLIDDVSVSELSYIVEPEVVEDTHVVFQVEVEDLKKDAQKQFEHYQRSKKLRPPDEIRLLIDPDFIISGETVNSDEFEVLSGLSEYNKVGDIYKNVNLLDYEVTNALVSLRMKKALKVFR